MKIICLENENLRIGWIDSMNFDGKDFNDLMKFLTILGLIGLALWETKDPICLLFLVFLLKQRSD